MSQARAGSGPSATVAMVTYNSSRYVAEAIESVLAQDFGDFELLVCDDHSTDGTADIAKRFADPRIRILESQVNLGEYANRNRALEHARGRYIVYIDGDDLLYSHGLGVMVRAMERSPHASFAAARPWSEQFVYPVELAPRDFFLCEYLGPGVLGINFAHLVFRTASLRAADGFDPRFRLGDSHVQYRLAVHAPCVLIPNGLSWWRRTPGQASENLLRDSWFMAEAVRFQVEFLERDDCPLSAAERRLARTNVCGVFLRVLVRYALRGRLLHAARLLRSSGLASADLRHTWVPSRRPFLAQVTAADPIRGRIPPALGVKLP